MVAGASSKGCMSYFQFQELFVILDRPGSHLTHMFVYLFIRLFYLMLNVHGKELSFVKTFRYYPHCSWASLPEIVHHYKVHILSPVTDN